MMMKNMVIISSTGSPFFPHYYDVIVFFFSIPAAES